MHYTSCVHHNPLTASIGVWVGIPRCNLSPPLGRPICFLIPNETEHDDQRIQTASCSTSNPPRYCESHRISPDRFKNIITYTIFQALKKVMNKFHCYYFTLWKNRHRHHPISKKSISLRSISAEIYSRKLELTKTFEMGKWIISVFNYIRYIYNICLMLTQDKFNWKRYSKHLWNSYGECKPILRQPQIIPQRDSEYSKTWWPHIEWKILRDIQRRLMKFLLFSFPPF